MATMREVMLSGVPAKLAHMIASNAPAEYTPAGTDINSATLLESNVVIAQGATAEAQGFRLRPASGQYLHMVRNVSGFGINVYPDFTEQMNVRAVGVPWYIANGATGFFLPSRRQWLCGSMLNDRGTGMQGPVTIGAVQPPANGDPGDLFVGHVLCGALGLRNPGASPTTAAGRFTFNAYLDPTGIWRYLGNGPAMQMRFDAVSGVLAFHTAVSGLAGPLPR